MSYSHIDHSHCWGSDNPPCGQKIEHLVCCLCGLSHPSIKASIVSARGEERKKLEKAIESIVKKQEGDNCMSSDELLEELDKNKI